MATVKLPSVTFLSNCFYLQFGSPFVFRQNYNRQMTGVFFGTVVVVSARRIPSPLFHIIPLVFFPQLLVTQKRILVKLSQNIRFAKQKEVVLFNLDLHAPVFGQEHGITHTQRGGVQNARHVLFTRTNGHD
jgi:hypothetical protein